MIKKGLILSVFSGLLVGLLMFIICLCSGCRVMKHSSDTVITDTTSADTCRDVAKSDSVYHFRQEKDSAIGIKGGSAHIHLTPDDLAPAFTIGGVRVPRLFVKDSGNTHAKFKQNADGSADVDCNDDSLTLVINFLLRDSIYSHHTNDSLLTAIKSSKHETHVTTSDVIIKGDPWWQVMGRYLLAMVIGAIVWEIIKLLKKV